MAVTKFLVKRYTLAVGHVPISWNRSTLITRGYLICYGSEGQRFITFFLEADRTLPSPVYQRMKNTGAVFLPVEQMSLLVDIVRSECPVWAYLDSRRPACSHLRVGLKPTGEKMQ